MIKDCRRCSAHEQLTYSPTTLTMSRSSHTDIIMAGAVAAFTVDMMIYPLDTLKTRQQSQDFLKMLADRPTKTRLPSRQLFKGLYQGIGIVVVATLPAAGTFFTVYEASKSLLGRQASVFSKLPQPIVHSGASAIAECASCLVLTPAEVIKQNAQVLHQHSSNEGGHGHPYRRSTSLQSLRQLGGADAGRRLLSGYTALVARNLPFTAIQFPIFEFARTQLWLWRRRRRRPGTADDRSGFGAKGGQDLFETGVVTGTSAGLAGSFAALITTPMDVVKTRIMLLAGGNEHGEKQDDHKRKGNTGQERYAYRKQGGLAIAREVVSKSGVSGLFRGAVLRSVWTAMGSGLYLGMYEVAKTWLGRARGNNEDDFSIGNE
ncbi:mitochondrial carrier domain-containing protein [Xylaria nigripes]|nr:mitochondrial carrier domain-containing protein [Xylaria nigripes]